MSAGWLYYHKYPPKRKCSVCGKRHYAKRIGTASNGEDFWRVFHVEPRKKRVALIAENGTSDRTATGVPLFNAEVKA